MNNFLVDGIEEIFNDINRVIFETEKLDLLANYIDRLKKYAKHINICGENRNSYSKTINVNIKSATFYQINMHNNCLNFMVL